MMCSLIQDLGNKEMKSLITKKINYLTVPIKKKGLGHQLIKEAKVDDKKIFDKHLTKIYHAYSKSKYFKKYFQDTEKILKKCEYMNCLSEINIYIIQKLCEIIGIDCNYKLSSNIKSIGKKTDKLISICKTLDKKEYLINTGAVTYISDDKAKFDRNNINLYLLNFKVIPYNQLSDKFQEKLSIIDLLFNEGPNALYLIKKAYSLIKI